MAFSLRLCYIFFMKLIGENIHIISKRVREALVNRDESFIIDLINKQNQMDCIDLNVGPAKGEFEGVIPWLVGLVENNSKLNISFDTTNSSEMKKGLDICKNCSDSFINSASCDYERLESMTDLASEYKTNIIGLTLSSKTGIPKTSDGRVELALEIYETCMMKEIPNEKIYFDPLILPVSVEQSQVMETLNTIKILKESFEPACKTVVGLSNISNGSPKDLRPLINRTYLSLAYGAGLDCAIIDACDDSLIHTIKMLESGSSTTKADELLLNLSRITSDFADIEDISYDKNDKTSSDIYRAALVLLNKEIYSHSFTQV